jgi:hypothetical protein
VNNYLALVYRAASVDATIATAFMRVINPLDTPQHLQEPAMVARVMKVAAVGDADPRWPVHELDRSTYPISSASKAISLPQNSLRCLSRAQALASVRPPQRNSPAVRRAVLWNLGRSTVSRGFVL